MSTKEKTNENQQQFEVSQSRALCGLRDEVNRIINAHQESAVRPNACVLPKSITGVGVSLRSDSFPELYKHIVALINECIIASTTYGLINDNESEAELRSRQLRFIANWLFGDISNLSDMPGEKRHTDIANHLVKANTDATTAKNVGNTKMYAQMTNKEVELYIVLEWFFESIALEATKAKDKACASQLKAMKEEAYRNAGQLI